MNEVANPNSSEILAAREASKASIAFGTLLTVLGIFAVLAPLFTGVALTALVGMLLIAGGIVEIVFAFQAESFGKGVLKFLFGGLGAVAGIIVVATPVQSLGMLTFVLAGFFVAGGIVDIVLSLKTRGEEGWGWMREASTATRESWSETQREANEAFHKLQAGISEATAELRKELGLEEAS